MRYLKPQFVSPNHENITARHISRWHAMGAQVVPWTANTPEAWDCLVALGVDGIITDDPSGLLEHLGRLRREER